MSHLWRRVGNLKMDVWLALGVVGVILAAALLGVRRYRWQNILWGVGGGALFMTVSALAQNSSPIEPYVLISLAALAGGMAQHAYEDEKHREKERRASLGLPV